MRVKIDRLFNKIASVRDYIVDRAIATGEDLVLECNNKVMTIKNKDIQSKVFQINPVKYKSKYYSDQEYALLDFKWEEDVVFNPDNPKEHWVDKKFKELDTEDRDKLKTIQTLFNVKEEHMSFDLSGYKPETVKDNDFEVMTGKNNICKVNSAKIEDVEGGTSERTGETYEAYTRFRYELEVVSEKFNKRRVWKSYNLDSTEKTGKKEKTPIQKLADAFFTIGLEFSDLNGLHEAVEKFADMTLVVSFSKFTPKGEKEARQLHTITGIAPEGWEDGAETTATTAEKVEF